MNPFFVDYLIPTINMMPRIETTLVHGYPGAGEISCVPPMAAIANAIFCATGARISKLPLNQENVLRALKIAGKAQTQKQLEHPIGRYGLLTRSVTFLKGKQGGFLVLRLKGNA